MRATDTDHFVIEKFRRQSPGELCISGKQFRFLAGRLPKKLIRALKRIHVQSRDLHVSYVSGGRVILVVDDHAESAYVLKRLLISEGFKAAAVHSGKEALQFLCDNPVSLVILDYHMPGMDGLTVFRTMQSDATMRHVPVIVFSAYDGQTRDAALREGVSAWVLKGSLDISPLFKEIARLIGPASKLPDARQPGCGRGMEAC